MIENTFKIKCYNLNGLIATQFHKIATPISQNRPLFRGEGSSKAGTANTGTYQKVSKQLKYYYLLQSNT